MNVKELLQQIGIRPTKKMGQSFLTSEKIANRIVSEAEIGPNDIIIEAGAGLGILTDQLCAHGGRVFAVEKDPILFEFLGKRFQDKRNLTLLNQDILSFKVSSIQYPVSSIKLVSNLPYSITSNFLHWLLENRTYLYSCILTLQKEVSQKIYASPGTKVYGAISVILQFCMQIKPLFLISGDYFFPKSSVISEVISLKPKQEIPAVNEKLFFKIVHIAFAERRKQLKNSLKLVGIRHAMSLLNGIDLSRRPETLTYDEFIKIANALQKC